MLRARTWFSAGTVVWATVCIIVIADVGTRALSIARVCVTDLYIASWQESCVEYSARSRMVSSDSVPIERTD